MPCSDSLASINQRPEQLQAQPPNPTHTQSRTREKVYETVETLKSDYPSLRLGHGKCVLELRPDITWDKGKAMVWLLEALGLRAAGEEAVVVEEEEVCTIYIGDDVTDEDAFHALVEEAGRMRGIGIVVTDEDKVTGAKYSLRWVRPSVWSCSRSCCGLHGGVCMRSVLCDRSIDRRASIPNTRAAPLLTRHAPPPPPPPPPTNRNPDEVAAFLSRLVQSRGDDFAGGNKAFFEAAAATANANGAQEKKKKPAVTVAVDAPPVGAAVGGGSVPVGGRGGKEEEAAAPVTPSTPPTSAVAGGGGGVAEGEGGGK